MNKISFKYIFYIFSLLFILLPFYSLSAVNEPSIEGGNCQGCHVKEQILPAEHPDTNEQSLSDCRGCHDTDLRGKMSLSHVHNLAEVNCADCHGSKEIACPPDKSQCFDCHGTPQEIAKQTSELEINPHNSPHYGQDLDCDLCHHLHKKSENFCNECHTFSFIVP